MQPCKLQSCLRGSSVLSTSPLKTGIKLQIGFHIHTCAHTQSILSDYYSLMLILNKQLDQMLTAKWEITFFHSILGLQTQEWHLPWPETETSMLKSNGRDGKILMTDCCQVTWGACVKFPPGTMTLYLLSSFLHGSSELRFYYHTGSIFSCQNMLTASKLNVYNNFLKILTFDNLVSFLTFYFLNIRLKHLSFMITQNFD